MNVGVKPVGSKFDYNKRQIMGKIASIISIIKSWRVLNNYCIA